MDDLLLAQQAVSFALFGLIWTIQLVHYPSFRFVEPSKFIAFEKFHSAKITLVVGPLMLIELVVSAGLVYLLGDFFSIINLVIVGVIWLSTLLLSIPRHNKLLIGKDDEVIESLILTNWPRTVLWSLKSAILLFAA